MTGALIASGIAANNRFAQFIINRAANVGGVGNYGFINGTGGSVSPTTFQGVTIAQMLMLSAGQFQISFAPTVLSFKRAIIQKESTTDAYTSFISAWVSSGGGTTWTTSASAGLGWNTTGNRILTLVY